MVDQSIKYLILQIINVIFSAVLNILTIKYLTSYEYSLFAIYTIISGLFLVFTFLGFENVLIRNCLNWLQQNKIYEIEHYISLAFFSRIVLSVVLLPIIMLYTIYIYNQNYTSTGFWLFIGFIFAGIFTNLLNTNALILKSFNRYVLAFLLNNISALVIRVIAIVLLYTIGVKYFFLVLIIMPLIIFSISVSLTKKYIKLRYFKLSYLKTFKEYRFFIYSNYLQFLKMSFDQVIVSIFTRPEILATYNIAKRFEEISRASIEGYFDPMVQKSVMYKSNIQELKKYFEKVWVIQKKFVTLLVFFLVLSYVFVDYFIELLNLYKYQYISTYIKISLLFPLLYALSIVNIGKMSIFVEQKRLFKIDLFVNFFVTLILVLSFIVIPEQFLYFNRVMIVLAIFVFYEIYNRHKFTYSNIGNII